jgi:hypothetical protein
MTNNPYQGRLNEKIGSEWILERGLVLLGKHTRKNKNGSSRWGGWPDRIAIDPNDGSLHFFEVKTGSHELDPHQKLVLGALAHVGMVHLLHFNEGSDTITDIKLEKIPLEELISKGLTKKSVSL